jgi:hypothetical protein
VALAAKRDLGRTSRERKSLGEDLCPHGHRGPNRRFNARAAKNAARRNSRDSHLRFRNPKILPFPENSYRVNRPQCGRISTQRPAILLYLDCEINRPQWGRIVTRSFGSL